MEYTDLKHTLGIETANRLEDAVLFALAEARTPETAAALSRLMSCLTAAVAHRAEPGTGIADQCMTDFENALHTLRTGLTTRAC